MLTAAIFYDKLDTVDWLLSNHSKEELGLEDQITEQKSKSGRGSFPKEYSGCTPFLISIYKSSPEVIQLLIRSGA